jgi:hypothetical protein
MKKRKTQIEQFREFRRLPEYWSGRLEPPSVLEFINAVRNALGKMPIETDTRCFVQRKTEILAAFPAIAKRLSIKPR